MRFAKWNHDGSRLIYEDGAGGIRVKDATGDRDVARGWGPVWFGDLFIYADDAKTYRSDGVVLYDKPLRELAAGGGKWAGTDRSNNHLIVNGKDEGVGGLAHIDKDGNLIFFDGVNRFEPTILGNLTAWVLHGVVTSWGHHYEGEGWPRLISSPERNYLLTMTHNSLRVRVVNWNLGWEIETGNNQNLEPDGVVRGDKILIACSSGIKEIDIDAPLKSFDVPIPDDVEPPPPPPPPMTPNRLDVVRDEFGRQPPAPNSTESCGEFTRRVARGLHAEDPNWGMLTKNPGEEQYQGFAVDAIIYKPTQQVIDLLGGAGGPNPSPAWQEVPKRDTNHWAIPPAEGPWHPDRPDDPPPPDTSGELLAELRKLTAAQNETNRRLAEIEAARIQFAKDIVLLGARLDNLAGRKYRVVLSRDWGHSHRGTVEVIE